MPRTTTIQPQPAPIVDFATPPPDLISMLAAPRPAGGPLLSALSALRGEAIAPLLQRIAYHRIDGLAHRVLTTLPVDRVHPWLIATLRRRRQRQAAATLAQGLALAEVLETLQRSRVPVIVMRGLRTVEAIYGDPGARPFEDHDLLILPGDLLSARRAFARLGFSEEAEGLHRRGGMLIDLHSDPLGARRRPTRRTLFPVPVTALFDRAPAGRVAGAPALFLSPEDDLLLMAIHLVKHSFDRLIRVADLAHLLTSTGATLDWERIRRCAQDPGMRRILGWGLAAAGRLGASSPPDLMHGGRPGRIESFLMERALALRPVPWCGEALMVLAVPTWRNRILFVLDALLPAGECAEGGWGRVSAIPRRSPQLMQQGARTATSRMSFL